MHPRMQLLLKGQLVAIQFGDAVALCAPGTEYTDRLELKSATDRTFGIGVAHGDEDLVVLTAVTLMKVITDAEKIASFRPACVLLHLSRTLRVTLTLTNGNCRTGRANIIKSTMTQAILYGSHPEVCIRQLSQSLLC